MDKKMEFYLFDKYIAGDRDAGNKLFASIFPDLEKYVYSKTSSYPAINYNEQSEIISETLKRAVCKAHTFKKGSSFKTFVFGFANKIILEKIREISKSSIKTDSGFEIDDSAEDVDVYVDPVRVLLEKESLEEIESALNQLTEEQKQVFLLKFHGKKSKEISELSGKSVDAIDSLYARALRSLRMILKK